ncbi:MAG: ABC transporter permease [Endomicrobiales bacterium]|jgi:phospholipid/cholesterol/gamma-HCH transport system permease protein
MNDTREYPDRVFYKLGIKFLDFSSMLGRVTLLVIQTFGWILRGAINTRNTVIQMVEIGINSSPVIILSSLFTGMVLALQTGASARNIFNEPIFIGTVVGFSLVKELGPVLTAVVISGRVGASIAAEIGTMSVTEQLDALYTLGTNPVRYLAVPRFIACGIMVPVLTVMANIIGILGGLLVTIYRWDIPSSVYWDDIFNYMLIRDFMHGFIKSIFFGLIIVTVAVYQGFQCEGGAEGVGRSTTGAVMISMMLILISDYFLTALLVALGIG